MASTAWILVAYVGAGGVIVGLAAVFYLISVNSRKQYQCPACGEFQRVEHMTAHHCSKCGAPLKENAK